MDTVSIHAPRAERDVITRTSAVIKDVSIHAPRAERDLRMFPRFLILKWFQSTRPGRSATESYGGESLYLDVSIHAPRAERDVIRMKKQ